MPYSYDLAQAGIGAALGALSARIFPWIIAAVVSRGFPSLAKMGAVALYAAAVTGLYLVTPKFTLHWSAAGFVYFGALACGVYWLSGKLRAGVVTKGGIFVVVGFAFLLLPAIVVPRAVFLVFGWSMMLSSYSYCVDISRRKEEPELKECLVFLLVNPVLVFSERGRLLGRAGVDGGGLTRAAAGAVVFGGGLIGLKPLMASPESVYAAFGLPSQGIVVWGVYAALVFATEYALHSGLASVYVGLMRQLGYVIPERYHYPFLANSLADFWRRWNTYLGSWIRIYVFTPMALRLQRMAARRRGLPRGAKIRFSWAAAMVVAFVVVGLLHDGYVYASNFWISTSALKAFSVVGGLMVVWFGLASAGQWLARRAVGSLGRWTQIAASTMSRAYVFCSAIVFVMLWK